MERGKAELFFNQKKLKYNHERNPKSVHSHSDTFEIKMQI